MKKRSRELKYQPRPEFDIDKRLVELRAEEHDLRNKQISLEQSGISAERTDEHDDLEPAAYALLTGNQTPPPLQRRLNTLAAVKRERAIVARAISIGEQMSREERANWAALATVERMDTWRRLVRETAVAVIELQKLNRERDEFKRALGGMPSLPCNVNGGFLLGCGVVGDEVYQFVQSVVRAGIITPGEIEKIEAT